VLSRLFLLLFSGLFLLFSVFSYGDISKEDVRDKLNKKYSSMGYNVGTILDIPVDGFYEAYISSKDGASEYFYVSKDAKWLIRGDIIDIEKSYSLTDKRSYQRAIEIIETFGEENLITFKSENETKHIYVYTDSSCGFCRKLHNDINRINNAGITVSYLPFPRGGREGPGYKDLVKAWCSVDRNEGIHLVKTSSSNEIKEINNTKDCERIVMKGYQSGIRSGVDGTPRVYSADGHIIRGYPGLERLKAILSTEGYNLDR